MIAPTSHDLTALGARWNGTTTADRTNYFETSRPRPTRSMRRSARGRPLPAGTLHARDLASEMTVVRNELERQEREPMPVVMRTLQRLSYTWHGYGRPTIGARSDIEGAPFEALQAFHRRHYRPDNAALIVSGQFNPQQVLKLAAQLFAPARNPDQPRVAHWTREPAEAATRRSELALPAGTTLAASGWRLPGSRSARRRRSTWPRRPSATPTGAACGASSCSSSGWLPAPPAMCACRPTTATGSRPPRWGAMAMRHDCRRR